MGVSGKHIWNFKVSIYNFKKDGLNRIKIKYLNITWKIHFLKKKMIENGMV